MRATIYTFTLSLLTSLSLNAQIDTSNIVYFDNQFRSEEEIEFAAYYGVPKKIGSNRYEVTLYLMSGQKFAKGEYVGASLRFRNGVFVLYDQKGRITMSAVYHNNIMDGAYQSWHSNGVQADSGRMARNQFIGLWKSWYPNGQLKDIKNYKLVGTTITGIDGEYRSWDSRGRLVDSGFYKNGNRTGVWVEWKWNGEIRSFGGHTTDVPYDWARYGVMRSVGAYKKDLKVGDWKYYDSTGNLLYMRRYSKDDPDEEGEIILFKKD
jgi:antitoxin component YwqK of YwqJK toxin-antitoxin module